MKMQFKIIGALLAAATFGSASAGPIFPNRDLSFSFDGFCDGMSLHIDTTKGTATGVRTGCASTLVAGVVASVLGTTLHGGIVTAITDGAGGYLTMYIGDNKKWTIYATDGTIFQSGTWTLTPSAVMPNPNAPSITDR